MNTGVVTLRKSWPALAAIVVLVAVTLSAGALFAASERQRPELPAANPQSADAAGPAPAVESPAPPPAPERGIAQPADGGQEEIDLPPITKEPPKYPNLDSNLNRLVEQELSQTRLAGQPPQTDSAGGGSGSTANPALVTFYVEPEQVANLREYLEDNGVYVRNVGEDYLEAHVPPALLPAASELLGVRRVATVIPPRPAHSRNRVISQQGQGDHGADAWHNAGYRGQGVKVGVIDFGFEGFRRLQGSELPASVTARCYFDGPRAPTSRLADCEAGGVHGTAVAKMLVYFAPDVELYIANPISYGDLRNAVDWMAGQGVQVINFSQEVTPDGPGDGTSPFSDSPLRTIDAAVSSGITWVTAGGNSARNVWYGTFSDPDGNGLHNFTRRDHGNTFQLYGGERPSFYMRWDDNWGQADCDLDLLLTRLVDNGNLLVSGSRGLQDGSPEKYPDEFITYLGELPAAEAGSYDLWITMHKCPDAPAWIQLTTWIHDHLQYYSPTHHITSPAESRNPGLLAVGATGYWTTNRILYSSSRGPTLDGRTKPDITGICCSDIESYSDQSPYDMANWFRGTSSSAPRVAGLAALVRQRFPGYTPAQTVNYLQQHARERGAPGKDNTWGHGLAALPAPQSPTPAPIPTPTPAFTLLPPGGPPTANIAASHGAKSGEVIVSWDYVPEATHYRIGYVNMATDYPRAKDSVTGDWINALIYVDEDARNLPVANGRVEYTLRRLEPGVRHAITVLASNVVINTKTRLLSIYRWPQNPRWEYLETASANPNRAAAPVLDYGQQYASKQLPFSKGNTGVHGLEYLPYPSSAPASAPGPGVPPTANIAVCNGPGAGEATISWDFVPGATHYRIGYVNMATDYPRAKASATGDWINAFIYVDEDARNLPVINGRTGYTIRRLAPGVRHAITVLTSNVVSNTKTGLFGIYKWPQNPRWKFLETASPDPNCTFAAPRPASTPSPTATPRPTATPAPTPKPTATPAPAVIVSGGRSIKQWSAPPAMAIDPGASYTAVLNTTAGPITIELLSSDAPITVNNFVFLAREGFYDNVIFHRTIPGFMIQGGDPTGTGAGGPGYRFADETVNRPYSRGVMAMANAGPNTNGSQFFIMHADYPLPPNYTIFGQAVAGLETIDTIATAPTKPGGEGSSPVNPVTIQSVEIVGP